MSDERKVGVTIWNWKAVGDRLANWQALIPYGKGPVLVYPLDPEYNHKVADQLRAHEEQWSTEVNACIRELFAKRKWPRSKSVVRYFADARFGRVREELLGYAKLPRPLEVVEHTDTVRAVDELCEWLVTDFHAELTHLPEHDTFEHYDL